MVLHYFLLVFVFSKSSANQMAGARHRSPRVSTGLHIAGNSDFRKAEIPQVFLDGVFWSTYYGYRSFPSTLRTSLILPSNLTSPECYYYCKCYCKWYLFQMLLQINVIAQGEGRTRFHLYTTCPRGIVSNDRAVLLTLELGIGRAQ